MAVVSGRRLIASTFLGVITILIFMSLREYRTADRVRDVSEENRLLKRQLSDTQSLLKAAQSQTTEAHSINHPVLSDDEEEDQDNSVAAKGCKVRL